jgi:hypothetical protein
VELRKKAQEKLDMAGVPIEFHFEGSVIDSDDLLSDTVSRETDKNLCSRIILEVIYPQMSGDETIPMSLADRFLLNRPQYHKNSSVNPKDTTEEQPCLPVSVAEKFLLKSNYPGEDILAMY